MIIITWQKTDWGGGCDKLKSVEEAIFAMKYVTAKGDRVNWQGTTIVHGYNF